MNVYFECRTHLFFIRFQSINAILEIILSALRKFIPMMIWILVFLLKHGYGRSLPPKKKVYQELIGQPLNINMIPAHVDFYLEHPMKIMTMIPAQVDCYVAPFAFARIPPRRLSKLKLKIVPVFNERDVGFEIIPLRKGRNSSDRHIREKQVFSEARARIAEASAL